MNKYFETPGLHVVSLYAQVHKLAEVEELVTKHNIKYPLAMDSFWDAGYEAPTLPMVWIVGPDGLIKFIGRNRYDAILKEELAKVKYPGLGRASVCAALVPAAELYVRGKYADAYTLAEKIYDVTEDETEEDDADWIMKRIDARARALQVRAESAEVERQYEVAIRCWEALAKFKGISDAEDAPERLKKLQQSDEIKKEIAARRALLSEMMDLEVYHTTIDREKDEDIRKFREKCLETYKKFVADHKGTGAAERAQELVEIFTSLLKPPEDKPDKPPAEEK